MMNRLLITALSLATLATCQTQKKADSTVQLQKVKDITSPKVSRADSLGLPVTGIKTKTKSQDMDPKLASKQGIIYLKEGETQFLKEYDMNVTFKQVLEDSRCPQDVNCVWIGNAIAEIELMGTYTRPVTIKLSTTANESRGFTTAEPFNGYNISLVQLTPETTQDKGYSKLKGEYKVALQIQKQK